MILVGLVGAVFGFGLGWQACRHWQEALQRRRLEKRIADSDRVLRRDFDAWERIMTGCSVEQSGGGPYVKELARIMLKKGPTTGCCERKDERRQCP